jgi:hypothetical protein
VTLRASEAATIHYTLDGTTPTLSGSTYSTPIAITGNTSLAYLAVDAAGNVSPVTTSQYAIGSLSISSAPAGPTNNNRPTFSFASPAAGATYMCALSAGISTFAPCTSPITYPPQADGTYTFTVQGADAAGHSLGSDSARLVIDTVAPTAPVLSRNPSNPNTSATATFAFTAESGAAFNCSLVQSTARPTYAACSSPVTFGALTDGSYAFQVTATDAAENVSTPTVYQFQVAAQAAPSTTAPVASLRGLVTAAANSSATTSNSGPLTASTVGVPVVISWTGTACNSGVDNCNVDHYVLQQSVNGGPFATVTLPSPTATSITLNLKPSPINNSTPATTYRFQVQAVDAHGNFGPFSNGAPFTLPDTDNSFSSSFSGSWSGVNLASALGGSVHESTVSGATAAPSNSQSASGFAWISTVGPDRGKAQVKVDGQVVATIDLYAPTQAAAQVVWAINGLSATSTHQIQVVSTGTRNAAASGTKVDYDAILALK